MKIEEIKSDSWENMNIFFDWNLFEFTLFR